METIFPKCPVFNVKGSKEFPFHKYCPGVLVPFSYLEYVFYNWKCTVCGHEVKG